MKLICEYCKKEYNWEEGQLNWTKDGAGKIRGGTVNAKKYCCFKCGRLARKVKREQTCLEKYGRTNVGMFGSEEYIKAINDKYGVDNPSKSKDIQEKISKTKFDHSIEDPEYWNKIANKRIETRKQFIEKDSEYLNKIQEKISNTRNRHIEEDLEYWNKIISKRNETINKLIQQDPEYVDRRINKISQTNIETKKQHSQEDPDYYKKISQKILDARNKHNQEDPNYWNKISKKRLDIMQKHAQEDPEYLNNIQEKTYNTKKQNNSWFKCSSEIEIYKKLIDKFGEEDVEWQYRSKLYPFSCDFYIKSLDLYIEYQGIWLHGKEPYNENNEEHKKLVESWKNKNSEFYKNAIRVWTISDPLKRQTAKENGLNWIEFFNMKEFYEWYK